ncbi:bifunctional metallophosphatase/5'-nucleotidase [Enterococcus timonensis]|uniref:bifunctional metallophosphatase/5'-nucleotidase n=1 Tax=Enterococcus timonensis TaxID=1852364 RepID=UPI0008D9C9A0|nr:bifunctional metallophosphatase/5'-nucleotidase [Enterococcus timonensis]
MKRSFWLSKGSWLVLLSTVALSTSANIFAEEGTSASTMATTDLQVSLQLLGINDFHGALETTGTFRDDAGNSVSSTGTAALLAGYLDQAESNFVSANPNGVSLRVQSGDMVGASPANSGLLQDEPSIKILNQMNFSVGTLGNHEFDEGLAEFNRIMNGAMPEANQFSNPAIQELVEGYAKEASNTEIVIANLVDKESGEIPFDWQPYTVKEVTDADGDKVNVGFIGIVTTEVPNLVLKEHYEDYSFLDEAETIEKYADELKADGVNAIVVLAHVPSNSDGEGNVSSDAAAILEEVNVLDPDNSVDVFFAGHNHMYTNGLVEGTRVVQSTSQGKGYIDVQGTLDVATQDFKEVLTATVNAVAPDAGVVPNEEVQAIVDEANDLVAPIQNAKIGTAEATDMITREVNENRESPVGNLIVDGQIAQAKVKGLDVDFAMTNNGGIRADLLVTEDGTITWGAAQAVQPFGNIMQIVEMTGEQIHNVLQQQSDKYFLQIGGLRYSYLKSDDATHPEEIVDMVKTDGSPVIWDETYRVVINDFLFGGGDGFSGFTEAKLVGAMDPDTETFVNYISSFGDEKIKTPALDRKNLVESPIEEDGWRQVEGQWTYWENDQQVTGWIFVDGSWYYLNAETGFMTTGWQEVNGKWYYLSTVSGKMLTGWLYTDGSWYYLSKTGAMQIGWAQVNGQWYYLSTVSGKMQTGWLLVNHKWYYATENGDLLVSTKRVIRSVSYTFDLSGAWVA